MKLLILCAVLSVILAVSFAGPIDSSGSSESSELKDIENKSSSSSSSSEEEEEEKQEHRQQVKIKNYKIRDDNEDDISTDTSKEVPDKNTIAKDEVNENSSSLEEETEEPEKRRVIVLVDDNEIIDTRKLSDRHRRAIELTPHPRNQVTLTIDDVIKYYKYLELKPLRRDVDSDKARFTRSVDSSEENSSEEDKNGKDHGAQEHSRRPGEKPLAAPATGVVLDKTADAAVAETSGLDAIKSDTAPTEEHTHAETARRRRNADPSSEEDQSKQQHDENEVFIFSNENQQDSGEEFKSDHFKSNERTVLNENFVETSVKSSETKDSEDDYAQGCGGSHHDNQDDDSSENSNENNETEIDKY